MRIMMWFTAGILIAALLQKSGIAMGEEKIRQKMKHLCDTVGTVTIDDADYTCNKKVKK